MGPIEIETGKSLSIEQTGEGGSARTKRTNSFPQVLKMVKRRLTNFQQKLYNWKKKKRIPNADIQKTLSKITCLRTDKEGHESYEKLRLLSDHVLLCHRNRREVIDQDQEGSNANLPQETRFWDEKRHLRWMYHRGAISGIGRDWDGSPGGVRYRSPLR